MNIQNQIKRTLSKSTSIEHICGLLEDNEIKNRSELAELVCVAFGFYDPLGRVQKGGCLKALRELEEAGHFTLPEARRKPVARSPRLLSKPVPLPVEVPSQAGEVRGLELVLVSTPEQMRIWNELMIEEHPQGAGPLVGRQLRYLIGSQHGWLGGFGFAAAALQLADRDEWIGWETELRRTHLHFVVGMSRFLIRESVQCHNLASKMLSMSLAVLPADFEQRYGYRPWLAESFVDTSRYWGTCYQAANWIAVGKTKGRGRQDRFNQSALSPKEIYLYPIEKDFRRRMSLSPNAGLGPLSPADGLETEHWAKNEFGGAPLGDARLSKRLVNVAAGKAGMPERAFSGVAEGNMPALKGYYRMIDQPEKSAVNMANILRPHRKRTVRRMMGQKTVLCIQDGSNLDYTNLSQCEGLGKEKRPVTYKNLNSRVFRLAVGPCGLFSRGNSKNLARLMPQTVALPFSSKTPRKKPGS